MSEGLRGEGLGSEASRDERLRGVRGAVTVEIDGEQEILNATEKLVQEIILLNKIAPEDVASVWITVTEDLRSTFPAKALRSLPGWMHVPVMCATEIPVPASLPKCIRLMMHVYTRLGQEQIQHVYLENAVKLRPDLIK